MVTGLIEKRIPYLGEFRIYEKDLDIFVQVNNVKPVIPYMFLLIPKTTEDGYYLQYGGNHIILGYHYNDYTRQIQVSFGAKGIMYRFFDDERL